MRVVDRKQKVVSIERILKKNEKRKVSHEIDVKDPSKQQVK